MSKAPQALKPSKPKQGDHVFLVDGSGYIFRAYHALPPLNRKSDGLQVNAVLGFCNMLWKLLRDMKEGERPTHLAVVFDKSEQTFRTEFYPEYKANRSAPPDDLIPQFGLIREAVHAFDIPCLEQGGFEADDLIATYVREACELGATATIVSSDKDLMQLVSDCVIMYDTMKDKKIGIPEVIEKFGVPPDKVIEVQALIGDSTDNVPGVPGIGVKTAAQLIGEYGDLETLLKRAGEIKQDKRRQTLIDNADKARLSKRLVTLDDKVKLDVPLADLAVHDPDYKLLVAFLKGMEFNTLTRRVAEFSGIEAAEIEAAQPSTRSPRDREADAAKPVTVAATQSMAPGLPLFGGDGGAEETACRQRRGRQHRDHPASAGSRTHRSRAQGEVRPLALRDREQPRPPRSLGRARARDRRGRDQRRDRRRGPDAGDAVRPRAGGRTERSLLRAARPPQRRQRRRRQPVRRRARARPVERGRRAGRAQAAARRPGRAQGRPEPEIRMAAVRRARHRDAVARGHHADVLCARRRPLRPRQGGAGAALLQSHRDRLQRRDRDRQGEGRFRLRRVRQSRALRRRGRRPGAAADAGASAAHGGRAHDQRLRDAGASAAAGAGAHGAARHLGRPPGAVAAVGRIRAARRRSRSRSPRARRRSVVQSGQPEAARRHPVRQDGASRRHQDQDRPVGDRRARARRARRAGPRAAAEDPGVAADHQAQVDLHRRAAGLHQPDHQARAHQLRAGGDADRTALILRAEPAEHPGPHRGRPQDPARLRRRARPQARLRRLFADRAAAAWPRSAMSNR